MTLGFLFLNISLKHRLFSFFWLIIYFGVLIFFRFYLFAQLGNYTYKYIYHQKKHLYDQQNKKSKTFFFLHDLWITWRRLSVNTLFFGVYIFVFFQLLKNDFLIKLRKFDSKNKKRFNYGAVQSLSLVLVRYICYTYYITVCCAQQIALVQAKQTKNLFFSH